LKLTRRHVDELERASKLLGQAPSRAELEELFRVYRLAIELVAILERLEQPLPEVLRPKSEATCRGGRPGRP
jgi:hypothetical protein